MKGEIELFDPRAWAYRMTLTYNDVEKAHGKSSASADVVEGKFIELTPGERVVQLAEFTSDDPAFAGTMTMTYQLSSVPDALMSQLLGRMYLLASSRKITKKGCLPPWKTSLPIPSEVYTER